MTKFMKNVRLILALVVDRTKANPSIVFRSIGVGLVMESKFVVDMLFPAFLLNLVLNSKRVDKVLFVILLIGILLLIINVTHDVSLKNYRNKFTQAMHRWVLDFRNKMHSISLITAESKSGQKKFWRADAALFSVVDVTEVVFTTLFGRILTLVVTLYIFSQVHILAAILIWITIIIGFILDSKLSQKKVKYDMETAEKNQERKYMNDTMFELSVVRDIRFSNGKDFFANHYAKVIKVVQDIQVKRQQTNFRYQIALASISMIRTAMIYGLAIWRFSLGALPISDFLLFSSATQLMSATTQQIFEALVSLSKMAPQYEEILEFINLPCPSDKNGSLPMPTKVNKIEFDNVTFIYPNQEIPALKSVSFVLNGAETVALVGDNGAGKSTVIKLLLRLYQPSSGRILLNDIDINEYDYDSYHGFFSAAFQDFNIFSFTLGENLTFGEKSTKINENLSSIGLIEKIDSLPKGLNTEYSTMFADDGVLFSGGEAQKLVIARALCREKAKVLTLDEPTASLDAIAEYDLNKIIYGFSKDTFTLFVSHRFSTTRFCNKILVFDKGRLVEQGPHKKLLSDKKLYSQMFDMQIAFFKGQSKKGENVYE